MNWPTNWRYPIYRHIGSCNVAGASVWMERTYVNHLTTLISCVVQHIRQLAPSSFRRGRDGLVLGVVADVLLGGEAADDEVAVLFGDDVAVETFDDGLLEVGDMHDAVAGVVHADCLAYDAVAGNIDCGMLQDGPPCAEVAPAEIAGDYMDILRFLHYGIVDRDLVALREEIRERGGFVLSIERLGQLVHDPGNLRSMGLQLGVYRGHAPDEDTGVPEIVAGREILLGRLQVRLLLELGDFDDFVFGDAFGTYIAVTCLGTGWMDTDGHNGAVAIYGIQRLGDHLGELLGLEDYGVGRSHDDIGVRMVDGNLAASVCDTRGSVASYGLGKDLVGRNLRQLLADDVHVFFGSYDPETLRLADRQETVHRHLDQGPPDSKDIDELLRHFRRADRPQTAPNAACHYDDLCIHFFIFLQI